MNKTFLLSSSLVVVLAAACGGDGEAGPGADRSTTSSGDTTTSSTGMPSSGSGIGGSAGLGGMGPGAEEVVLLIPNSSDDSIGIYDADDGTFIRNFVEPNVDSDPFVLSTPLNAVQGPNGNIFVSDQIEDCVYEFDQAGAFVKVFADETDGLDNVRGIDFLGGDLLVSNANGNRMNRFDAEGNALPDFVGGGDFDPYDVMVADNGDVLVSQIAPVDQVQIYAMGNAGSMTELHQTNFPQQITATRDGNYLVAAFTQDEVVEITPTGMVLRTVEVENARGAYQLGNGNWLVTGGSMTGIREIDPDDGTVVTQVAEGSGFRFIEPVALADDVAR